MIKFNLNEQVIYDVYHMSAGEFVSLYKKIFTDCNDKELDVIYYGVRMVFQHRSSFMNPITSSRLDPVKFAMFKKSIKSELTDEEEKFTVEGDFMDKARIILFDDLGYKWNSDKIKAMLREGYTSDQIIKIFDEKVGASKITENYIKQYMPK
jgi:hypothetical protein